jgi:beta-N-acetylhexosaminidase
MVGHLTCAGIDDAGLPASLDPAVVGGILRQHLGYDGLVVTDALEMGAVSETICPASEQAVRAVEAGCDLVLCPTDFQSAYQGLLDAVASGRISQDRIDESCRRIIARKLSMVP